MANTFTAIETVELANSSTNVITFNNIPQTYTDLCVIFSLRNADTSYGWNNVGIRINQDSTASYKSSLIDGNESGIEAAGDSTYTSFVYTYYVGNTALASAYSSGTVWFPLYTTSQKKSIMGETWSPNTAGSQMILAHNTGTYTGTSAITRLDLWSFSTGFGSNWIQYSTATLYGLKTS